MKLNVKDVLRKKYEEQNFNDLLTECKEIRDQKIDEFIKDVENQMKEAMKEGKVKITRMGTALHVAEKDKIIRHFTSLGFDIDFREFTKRGVTAGCKFTLQWKHLLR